MEVRNAICKYILTAGSEDPTVKSNVEASPGPEDTITVSFPSHDEMARKKLTPAGKCQVVRPLESQCHT